MPDPSSVGQVLAAIPSQLARDRRYVIALAGPPAAGKSTLAAELRDALKPRAAVLGLDAFHYDEVILEARGDLARKGAPHTFDVAGYQRMLETLRRSPGQEIAIPRFDRDLELSRNAAEVVLSEHSIVITEGNYLLLSETPWSNLSHLFDLTVAVTASIAAVESRIMDRWRLHGFNEETARQRLEENDLPNAQIVIESSRPAEITVGVD